MAKKHLYTLNIKWTGNKGQGTKGYRLYERSHTIKAPNKPPILASSDPAFLGDENKYNPEELLVASLSSCHMLWFLHLCSDRGIIVIDYEDQPMGYMLEDKNGDASFKEITLNPIVTITDSSRIEELEHIHQQANQRCFIAKSVNFPVSHHCQSKAID